MELLGDTIDNNLRFDEHVSKICLQAKLSSFLFKKGRILFKAFIEKQFKYCPLV